MHRRSTTQIRVWAPFFLAAAFVPAAAVRGDAATGEQTVRIDEPGIRFTLPGAWEERQRLHVSPPAPAAGMPELVALGGGRLRLGQGALRVQVDYVRFEPHEPVAKQQFFYRGLKKRYPQSAAARGAVEHLAYTVVSPNVRDEASLFAAPDPTTVLEAFGPADSAAAQEQANRFAWSVLNLAMQIGASGSSSNTTLDLKVRCRNFKPSLELVPRSNRQPAAPMSGVRALAFSRDGVEGLITARAEGPDEATVRRQLAGLDPIFARIQATLEVDPKSPARDDAMPK